MTSSKPSSIHEKKKRQYKQYLADCFRGYEEINQKIKILISAKKEIDQAWDISLSELQRLYEEERMVDVQRTPCGNYEPRF